MNILHFSNWAPRKSGLYECTKDQIKYERELGINSQLAIYEHEYPDENWIDENWLKPVSWDWAKNADLYIIHRGLPEKIKRELPKKTITVIHGTSDYLILNEILTKAESTTFNTHINLINNTDASVAVNKYDYEIYKLYDYNNKLTYIQDSIDVKKFNINGYKYPFMNHPQILFCDSLRINKHPAHIIWAMEKIYKEIPTARLTLVSLDLETILTWRNILLRSRRGLLYRLCENVLMEMTEIRPLLRGADILFNGNTSGIFSRVEMEAMSCGCQIVGFENEYTKWMPKTKNISDIANTVIDCWKAIENDNNIRLKTRRIALNNFDIKKNVKDKYIPLYENVLKRK